MERCHEQIKNASPNPNKVKDLVKLADARLNALSQITSDEQTSTIILEQYYESIKELLAALLLKDGKRSTNHECLIHYFKTNFPYFYEANFIEELRKYRNKINYEGLFVDPGYLERNKLELKHIVKLIKSLI